MDKVKRNTSLKDEILKCLDSYEIDTCQIYSFMTDNGANVLHIKEMQQEFQDDNLNVVDRHTEEETFSALDKNDGGALEDSIYKYLSSTLPAIGCITHNIQLAAYDVLKELQTELLKCRGVVKKIRTSISSSEVEIEMPHIDNATDWYSTYKMLKSLWNIKDYVCTMDLATNWDFIKDFVAAFDPLVKCTEQLQNDQYTAGDFYRDWFSCELELEDLFANTQYAKLLHKAMQDKRILLFENIAFISALYLDPRFNFINSMMLSEEQKNKAVVSIARKEIIQLTFDNLFQSYFY